MKVPVLCAFLVTLSICRTARPEQPNPRRVTNSVGMALVEVPAGKFRMGQGADAVDAAISRPFMIGQTEVTQRQWKKVMGTEPWKQATRYFKEGAEYPATFVSWADADEFCRKLTAAERKAGGLASNATYGLPTEAQWEYACRAGSTTHFSCGDDATCLDQCAWWGGLFGDGNARGETYPHEAATRKPNAWGLYDMHGNVSEWCGEIIDWPLKGGTDPVGPRPGGPDDWRSRVVRGGAWHNHPALCRSGHRDAERPVANASVGFRVVRTIP